MSGNRNLARGKYVYLERRDLGRLYWMLPPAARGAGAWVLARLPTAPGRLYFLHWKSEALQDEKYFSVYDVGLLVTKGEGEELWLLPAWPCTSIAVCEGGRFVHRIPLADAALDVGEAARILAKAGQAR